MPTKDKFLVLVTCGTVGEAEKIARELIEKRLAACVNLVESPVRSIYRWQGRIETASEYLLFIKSSRRKFAALREQVERLHSYDIPEVIAVPIVEGSPQYLRWLEESMRNAGDGSARQAKERRPSQRQRDNMKPLDLLPWEMASAKDA